MDGRVEREHDHLVVSHQPRRITPHGLRVRLRFIAFALDMVAIVAAFVIASLLIRVDMSGFAILGVFLPIYGGTAVNSNAYGIDNLCRASLGITQALKALLFTAGAMFLIAYFLRTEHFVSRRLLLMTIALAAFSLVALRQGLAALIERHWADKLVAEMVVFDRVMVDVPRTMLRVDAQGLNIRPDLRDPDMLDRFATLMRGVLLVTCR